MALPGNVGKGTIRIGDEFGLISEDLRGTKRIAGYAHVTTSAKREAAKTMGNLLSGAV